MDLFGWADKATYDFDVPKSAETAPALAPDAELEVAAAPDPIAESPSAGIKPAKPPRVVLPPRRRKPVPAQAELPSEIAPELMPAVLATRVLTAADALVVLPELRDLSPTMRREIDSAIRLLAKVSKREPAQISLAPRELVPLLRPILPAGHRISPKRWSNARSALRRLGKRVGHHAPDAVLQAPLGGPWKTLIEPLPNSPQTCMLRAFGRFCEREAITPDAVCEDTLKRYAAWLADCTYELRPAAVAQMCRVAWNHNVRHVPYWPQRVLKGRGHDHVVRLPDAMLPATLVTDIRAYVAQRSQGDTLEGPAMRPYSASTIQDRGKRLLYIASFLIRQGTAHEKLQSLGDLIEVDHLKLVIRAMHQSSTIKEYSLNQAQIAITALDVARSYLRMDEGDLGPLIALRQRLGSRRVQLSDRARIHLRGFETEASRRRLFATPAIGFAIAEKLRKSGRLVHAARRNERAIALAILFCVPLRRRSLAAIRLEHFDRDARGRIVRLRIDGSMVKNGVGIDAPVAPELADQIHRHLTVYRPHLPGAEQGAALFPGPKGAPKDPSSVARGVADLVKEHCGV